MKRLAIVATHPIQYFAPLFRLLTERGRITIKVFYTWEKGSAAYDKDFGKKIAWDIPLLDGYDHTFVSNGGSPRRDFRGVKNPGLEKAIEAWGAEAVLVIGWNYRSHLRAMRHFRAKIPVLFRGDSTLLDEQPVSRPAAGVYSLGKKILRRLFLRGIYRYVDIALYVGSRNKEYFLAHGLKERQLVSAPHAVENERFYDPDGEYAARAATRRAALGIAPQDLLIVFVGKFQEKKDPLLLTEAWKEIGEPDVHLLLVGDGELDARLREAAGQDSRIHFLPFQNQSVMPEIYRIGDVFCLPSKGPGETWGLAVNEAMACSRPVLVSDRCGCSADLVRNGRNGFIFAAGNKEELRARIRWFREQKDRLQEMGTASASIIRSWSFTELAAAMEKALNYGSHAVR